MTKIDPTSFTRTRTAFVYDSCEHLEKELDRMNCTKMWATRWVFHMGRPRTQYVVKLIISDEDYIALKLKFDIHEYTPYPDYG